VLVALSAVGAFRCTVSVCGSDFVSADSHNVLLQFSERLYLDSIALFKVFDNRVGRHRRIGRRSRLVLRYWCAT
jgi:hypothetical protein